VKEQALAEAQSTARVQRGAQAGATAKVQSVAKVQGTPEAQPVAEGHATPKAQPVVVAQATTEAPAAVASQPPIAKDQLPPGYRPPMSTLRFALILSLVAVGSALLTAGTYFLTTRGSPRVKVVTIRVPVAAASAVAAISPSAAKAEATTATAPPSPPPASAATAATAAALAPDAAPPTDQPATIRFVNPFDKKEVFVFPPGTSQADARDAVADLLAERARDRRGQLVKTPRRNGKTAADSGAPVVASGVAPRS
jgi:hypothetical protein